jgi:hypothetical protein
VLYLNHGNLRQFNIEILVFFLFFRQDMIVDEISDKSWSKSTEKVDDNTGSSENINDLYDDNLLSIFELLSISEKLQITLVCKKWRELIEICTRFHINLFERSTTKKQIRIIKKSIRRYRSISINPKFDIERLLVKLFGQGNTYDEVRIILCNVDKNGIRNHHQLNIDALRIKKVLEFVKNAVKIVIDIEDLIVGGNTWTNELIEFQNLQHVEINLTSLNDLQNSRKIISSILSKKLTVFKIQISEYSDYNAEDLNFIFELLLRNIDSIKEIGVKIGAFRKLYWNERSGILKLSDFVKHLAVFKQIFSNKVANMKNLSFIYCGKLEEITFLLSSNLITIQTDVELHKITAIVFEKLEKLNLYHVEITEEVIKGLSRICPNLKEVNFIGSRSQLPNLESTLNIHFPYLESHLYVLHWSVLSSENYD